ncbi:protein phosphatase methylesterase 1-like [Lingula anatina]|uniref:Protein phosphatase methylesterase 1 n=1 Tax=Lingula anatina TaxID=7574 RepID=A0A1S3GY91_LINAN|nr:protein phosphatase methylesterase 1-like [Lingula anatina]|eukprot:XP_013378840.1 protein phosphatase methylesterase 1-like [Lingula anatina]
MSALRKDLLKSKLPPMPPPGVGGMKRPPIRKRDYTPLYWDKYFDKEEDVKVDEKNIFRVYTSGNEGPVVFLLHGGGHSALSWAVFSSIITREMVCRCAAVDLRGHGDSQTADETDLSAETMSTDVGNIIQAMYGDDPPPIILMGHSMGGAIAVHTAHRNLVPSLIGLVVIDVVEGTALEALSSMQSFLRSRPKSFKSLEVAIEWAVRAGQIRNVESARVSMVGQVKRADTSETASSELEHLHEQQLTNNVVNSDAILEEEEEEDGESNQDIKKQKSNNGAQFTKPESNGPSAPQYTWRIDLTKTDKFWKGWFQGLSNLFLECNVPKMLLLAGVDRLDKDLTIGQMQGKFWMQVLPQCGHAVHEDSPDKVADAIASFMDRNKFAAYKEGFNRTWPCC